MPDSASTTITDDGIVNTNTTGWGLAQATTTTFGGSGTAATTNSGSSTTDPDDWWNYVTTGTWSPSSDGSQVDVTIANDNTNGADSPFPYQIPGSDSDTWGPYSFIPSLWSSYTYEFEGGLFGFTGFAGPGPAPMSEPSSQMPAPIGMGYNGVDFPGDSDAWANETPADGVSYLYTSPTLPCSLGTLPKRWHEYPDCLPGRRRPCSVWGMNFTAAAGYDSDSSYCTEEVLAAPQTLLADANNPAALPTFTSDTIRGAGAALGGNNIAPLVPGTWSSITVGYGFRGVSAGTNAPASGVNEPSPSMNTPTTSIVPVSYHAGHSRRQHHRAIGARFSGATYYHGVGRAEADANARKSLERATNVKNEIHFLIQNIANQIKQLKPGEELDISNELKTIQEYSKIYVGHLTSAFRSAATNTRYRGSDNATAALVDELSSPKFGGDVDGLNIFRLAGSESMSGLQSAMRETQLAIDGTVANLDLAVKALTAAQNVNDGLALAASVFSLGAEALATKSLAKGAGVLASGVRNAIGVWVAFQVGKQVLIAYGVSEDTINYVNVAANIVMLYSLSKGGCFVAGTPILLPLRPEASASLLAEARKPLEDNGDRDWLLAGAALIVGLSGMQSERSGKRKKKSQADDYLLGLAGNDDSDDESVDHTDALRSDRGIRDVCLVRRIACGEEVMCSLLAANARLDRGPVDQAKSFGPREATLSNVVAERSASLKNSLGTMPRPQNKQNDRPKVRVRRYFWLAAFALAAFFGVRSLLPSARNPQPIECATCATATRPMMVKRSMNVRVGQRVLARNPESREWEAAAPTAVDPSKWRHLVLRATVRDSDEEEKVDVQTLQPPEWVEANHAHPGASVPLPLELREMGLPEQLQGVVIENRPCPVIDAGEGRVVLTICQPAPVAACLPLDG